MENCSKSVPTTTKEGQVMVKQEISPLMVMKQALEGGLDLEKVEKMLELQAKWDAMEAKKAYTQAMADFKANPPEIIKDRKVDFETSKGNTSYTHATLGNVTNKINSALAIHGLSAGWETQQVDGKITVICRITHKAGHFETTSLSAAPDVSGNKNPIQAIGSTVTYLERYTLLALTGLATHDQDDDGRGSEQAPKYISEDKLHKIRDMFLDFGCSEKSFLEWIKAESMDKITESQYNRTLAAHKAKKGAAV